jgi:hypothetical protein
MEPGDFTIRHCALAISFAAIPRQHWLVLRASQARYTGPVIG